MESETTSGVVLATADVAVLDAVESVAATYGVAVDCVERVDEALAAWRSATVMLVGPDLAAGLAEAGPRPRPRVHLVGFDSVGLGTWSMPLGAEVIPLPQGMAWLSAVLSRDTGERAPMVAVLGGSGGVGASTFAAGLALAQARRGTSAALVDVDPLGGGLDLLMGAEKISGHRWPRLVEATGEVGDMRGLLPEAEGVTVLSMARRQTMTPAPEVVSAVTGSLARHHGLVVLDCGRHTSGMSRTLLRIARPVVVVCGGSVRAVAACGDLLRVLDVEPAGVVVRQAAGIRVPGEAVAEALGVDLWGVLPHDRRLVSAAEVGEPPWRSGSGWARAVNRILDRVLTAADDGD